MPIQVRIILLMGALVLWQVASGWAAEPDPVKIAPLELSDCIARALLSAPELGEAQADIELITAKLEEAKANRYPQIDFLALTGPVPQARGDQVSSPDKIDDTGSLTWFVRGDATLVQPLYTFGKIGENMKAATHGIKVEQAKKEGSRNEVVLKVKEYYYGLLLAGETKELLLEVQEDLQKARDTARKQIDQGSVNVDEMDIYKLDTFAGEVGKYLEEAKKGEALALAALRSRMNLAVDAPVELANPRLVPDERAAAELQASLDASEEKRPEYRQIREGLQAREALVKAARAAGYPDLFLAGYLSAANAEGRDKVTNPWVPDDYNHLWGGVALGLKWKLDFGITSAKVAAERAQYNRLLRTREFAARNIPLQIRKFYLDREEAEKSIASTRLAYTNAKRWSVAALSNFDFGIGPAKEIFDGLQEYARMRAAYFQAIYNYNMALANIAYAVGDAPLVGK